jgi:hypothetical protein
MAGDCGDARRGVRRELSMAKGDSFYACIVIGAAGVKARLVRESWRKVCLGERRGRSLLGDASGWMFDKANWQTGSDAQERMEATLA